MLALLLTGFGKSLIYHYGLLGFVLSGFDPVPRQDFAVLVCVSSKLSNERAALQSIHVRSVFIRLHSAKYRIGNEGKQNQLHIQKSYIYVCINVVKTLTRKGFNRIVQAVVYLFLQWYWLFLIIVFHC